MAVADILHLQMEAGGGQWPPYEIIGVAGFIFRNQVMVQDISLLRAQLTLPQNMKQAHFSDISQSLTI